MTNLIHNRKGQGTLEYVLIAAAVVALAVFLVGKFKEPAQQKALKIQTGLQQD